MVVKKTKAFERLLEKIIAKGKLTSNDVDNAIDLYEKDNRCPDLRPHWIECHKNSKLLSLSIPNSQYRMLATVGCKPKLAILHFIGTHKEYEVIIANQRNCKHIKHDCQEALHMPCYEVNELSKTNINTSKQT